MGIRSRLAHGWNAFTNQEPDQNRGGYGFSPASTGSYNNRPDRVRLRVSNERSIISSIYLRMSLDVALSVIRHVRLDAHGRYLEDMKSGLNNCLSLEANLDQASQAFFQDWALSLFEEGHIAIVPVETSLNPNSSGGWDVENMRVGKIVKWYPKKVRVNLYNEETGRREEVTLDKKMVAIVENPLYVVMNEPNSTLQRLLRKLSLLDTVDEMAGSGKLDMIIQLPYVIKNQTRRNEAEERRKDIENQLASGKYGIAYTDGSEKITQLNRPVENNLLPQVEMLMNMLYAQLGITAAVMDGTADEKVMLNYYDRTIEPILNALTQELKRKFLTKTARTQGQSIEYFRDMFKLVPLSEVAELADKLTRNEIASSNEMRQVIGWKPVQDPKADELRNSNMPQSELGTTPPEVVAGEVVAPEDEGPSIVGQAFDEVDAQLDKVFEKLGVEE